MAQVFIAHSSKDKWLIDPICDWLRYAGVTPYLAELESPTPRSLPDKLERAIKNSNAIVVVFTRNVASIQRTRDVVTWEVATAHAYKKPVYVFREKEVEVPLTIEYITDYFTFDPFDQHTLEQAVRRVYDIGLKLKKDEDVAKFIITGLFLIFGGIALGQYLGKKN